jgi:glutamine synthetase
LDLSSDEVQELKKDIKKKVENENIRFIRLQFTDIFGGLKNVSINSKQLDHALDNQVMFDGSSIKGFARVEESDMFLAPDPSTFTIFPWRSKGGIKTARLICDVHTPEGIPFQGCPRSVMKKILKELKTLGYELYVGPEVEFFLFGTDENGHRTTRTHDKAGYFDLAPTDLGEDARKDICLTLEEMGFEIEASHHEGAPGQHEVDFKYSDALTAADNVSTFKLVVKTIAKEHGLYATFMPKPLSDENGNCMHLNQSLFKNGKNAFYYPEDEKGLSQSAYYYIGGLLKYAREFAAITNPTVNSYKRLIPGFEAPTHIAWGEGNRSPLVRIPATRKEATRIELRNPDATANHYLALAAVLKAGMEGINNKIEPPKCCNGNVYDENGKAHEKRRILKFPQNLNEALQELKNSSLMRETLGDHIYNLYLKAKKQEWKEYSKSVHQWELNRYMYV